MQKLNIKSVGMWATPDTQKELQDMVTGLGTPEATHAMMFTWNYLSKVIDDYFNVDGGRCPTCNQDLPEWANSLQNPYAEINPDD